MIRGSLGIASTATIDYSSLGTLIDEDPLTRPKDAMRMVEGEIPVNPAAVIGGLLSLGDPRVCELMAPIAKSLDNEGVETLTKCFSGYPSKAIAEFYLDWIEELLDQYDPVS